MGLGSWVPGKGIQVECPGSQVPRMGPGSHFSGMSYFQLNLVFIADSHTGFYSGLP